MHPSYYLVKTLDGVIAKSNHPNRLYAPCKIREILYDSIVF